ncbi:MAG: hypothetical protein MJ252_27260, partial [archaeon]|nr:hypothetical protein [archaeon]
EENKKEDIKIEENHKEENKKSEDVNKSNKESIPENADKSIPIDDEMFDKGLEANHSIIMKNPEENSINGSMNILMENPLSKQTLFYDYVFETNNNWELVPMPETPEIDRDASTSVKLCKPPMEDILEISSPKKSKMDQRSKMFQSYVKTTKQKVEEEVPKKKKPVNYEIPCEEINEVNPNVELACIDAIRQQVLIEEKNKEIQRKLALKKQKDKEDQEKEKEKVQTDYKGKLLTQDVNGQIVFIKPLNLDSLQKGLLETKSISTKNQQQQSRRRKKKEKEEPEPIPVDEAKLKAKVEKNPIDAELNPLTKFAQAGIKDPKTFNYDPQNRKNQLSEMMLKLLDQTSYVPAGSSFENFVPEVGVTMKEDEKVKMGGTDFFKKYQRASNEYYQRQLGINIEQNKANLFSKTLLSPEKKYIPEVESNMSSQSKTAPNFYGIKETEEETKMGNTLKVNTKNLANAINNLDLINEADENMKKKFNKTISKNIFKKKKRLPALTTEGNRGDIDRFTKTLMGNATWGLHSGGQMKMSPKGPRQPIKLNDKQLEREINQGMMNRLPRNRKTNYVKTASNASFEQFVSNTIGSGFYSARQKLPKIGTKQKNNQMLLDKKDFQPKTEGTEQVFM